MSGTRQTGHRGRLSADDWADAALDVMAEGGLAAIGVEPLARRLEVTKGSFYWHFKNRDALIRASLRRWEQRAVAAIGELSRVSDPRERLRFLILTPPDRSSIRLDLAVSLSASDARVRPHARRVDRLWREWAEQTYRQIGLSAPEARNWAITAYAAYGGLIHLTRVDRELLSDRRAWGRYARHLVDVLVP